MSNLVYEFSQKVEANTIYKSFNYMEIIVESNFIFTF